MPENSGNSQSGQQLAVNSDIVKQIYDAHHKALERFVRRYFSAEDDVLDITQEVYTRLYRMTDFEGVLNNPVPWLYSVARNLIRDRCRRNKVRQTYRDAALSEIEQEFEGSPELKLERERKLKIIAECLQGLPADIRQAFLLNRLDRLTYNQVAERLSISDRTARRYVARALSVFKSTLEQRS